METDKEGSALAPWHIKVQITPEIATDAFKTIKLIDDEVSFKELLNEIYPEQDFQNKVFLDCGCNCGAYSFWAKSVGFSQCYGFDVREHWIKQAEWLKKNITTGPTNDIQFKIMDLYQLNRVGLPQFDLTFFRGLFHHLSYPIKGLKLAADLTKDVLIVNSKVKSDLPKNCFFIEEEHLDLLSGVDGLSFIPSGPDALIKILKWMGFVRFKVNYFGDKIQVIAYRKKEKIVVKQNKKVKI